MLKYILCVIFLLKNITTFIPSRYFFILQCTIANKKASMLRQNKIKKLDFAKLNISSAL